MKTLHLKTVAARLGIPLQRLARLVTRCWWRGHTPPPWGEGCVECGCEVPDYSYYQGGLRDILRDLVRRAKSARCPDCGKTYHKRNNHDGCIPF
jgi:hypothetical protein